MLICGLGGLHGDLGALSLSVEQWQRGRWIVWFIGSNGLQEETWMFGTKWWIQCLGRSWVLGGDLAWWGEELFRGSSRMWRHSSSEMVLWRTFWASTMSSLPFLRWRLLLDHPSYLPQGEHLGWHHCGAHFKFLLCVKVKQFAGAGCWGSCPQGRHHLPTIELHSHLF